MCGGLPKTENPLATIKTGGVVIKTGHDKPCVDWSFGGIRIKVWASGDGQNSKGTSTAAAYESIVESPKLQTLRLQIHLPRLKQEGRASKRDTTSPVWIGHSVPERVRAMNASIKLLLIVREPVTRAISDYTQLRSHAATATLPLANANEYQQQQQQQPQQSTSASSSSSSLNAGKFATHSMLYSKLNAGYSSSQVYDNSIGGGGGGGAGGGGGGVAGSGRGNYVYGSGAGGIKANYPKNSHRQYDATTTPSPSSAAAQILSNRSFEELAIFPNGTVNESYRPLTISMYHLHLHRWLEVFPREQILIVNGDRLIDDPVSQLKKIETFLGIEHRITSNHFYFNETKGFYCLRYDSGDRCLRETKGRKHPHVDPIVVSKLRKFFAEHNQRFYELVGEDLGWPEE
uniref:Sulfotransferase domain-containing protein n=1 Tax=Stomoxys calcitrans TaxID=35570 RepID=A0A1I8NRX1_STOCA